MCKSKLVQRESFDSTGLARFAVNCSGTHDRVLQSLSEIDSDWRGE